MMRSPKRAWNRLVKLLVDRYPQCATPVGTAAKQAFRLLDEGYSSSERHYHGWSHILHCIDELRRFEIHSGDVGFDAVAVETALWFHDVVYDPQRKDNEEKSAGAARESLGTMQMPADFIELVADLILATRHFIRENFQLSKSHILMLDIDLAILGAKAGRYGEYEHNIRSEYEHLEPEIFRVGRSRILTGFLERERIYHTEYFYRKYEYAARSNLTKAMATYV